MQGKKNVGSLASIDDMMKKNESSEEREVSDYIIAVAVIKCLFLWLVTIKKWCIMIPLITLPHILRKGGHDNTGHTDAGWRSDGRCLFSTRTNACGVS